MEIEQAKDDPDGMDVYSEQNMTDVIGLRKAGHGSHAGQVRATGTTIVLLPAFRLPVGLMPVVSCPVALLSIVKQPLGLPHVVPLVLDTTASCAITL